MTETTETDKLVASLTAALDEEEAAAGAACEPDVSRNGEWTAYPHPPGRKDGRQDRAVQLVGAGPDENSWTVCEVGQWDRAPMVAAHIARQDPARTLRKVAAHREILDRYAETLLDLDRARRLAPGRPVGCCDVPEIEQEVALLRPIVEIIAGIYEKPQP